MASAGISPIGPLTSIARPVAKPRAITCAGRTFVCRVLAKIAIAPTVNGKRTASDVAAAPMTSI